MKIFVLNNWSSSLKYQLLDMPNWEVLAEWVVEKIWFDSWILSHKFNWEKLKIEQEFKNHKVALNKVLETLTIWEWKVINNVNEIEAVWHRVVHGWEYFTSPVIVTKEVIDAIEKCEDLAPLHNKANKEWITIMEEILPGIKQVAVFDTAFHSTMKKENYLYPIPLEYYEKYKIRRYGFHGTSHEYVFEKASEILNKDKKDLKIINCHIWNWASICAISWGNVVETSMWFTPLEWLIMWTRSWDIDPSIITYIMKKENLTPHEIEEILTKNSWIKTLTWDSDLRHLEDKYSAWDEEYKIYMNMYINRIAKYIWSYYVLMWWADAITLCAWVMENSPTIRRLLVEKLEILWIKLNEQENDFRWKQRIISTDDSKIKVIVIPTNEELMIAKETMKLV